MYLELTLYSNWVGTFLQLDSSKTDKKTTEFVTLKIESFRRFSYDTIVRDNYILEIYGMYELYTTL